MGSSYRNAANGSSFGNLYGTSYKYGGSAGGHGHYLCQNGAATAGMGDGLWTSGNVTAYSDRRVKTNLEIIPDALAKVGKLNGYTFDRTDLKEDMDGNIIPVARQAGVIAQEVLEVLPEVVIENDEGMYSVAYGNVVALLIEAIKELKAEVDELKGNK